MSNMSSGGTEEPAGEETSKAPTRPGVGDKNKVQPAVSTARHPRPPDGSRGFQSARR